MTTHIEDRIAAFRGRSATGRRSRAAWGRP